MNIPAYHQNIITELLYQIIVYVEQSNEPYKVITHPYYLWTAECSVPICPDIAIIRHPRHITALRIDNIPLFAAEITTDRTRYTDYVTKLELYKKVGVKEYWIINWPDRILHICRFREYKTVSVEKCELPDNIPIFELPGMILSLDF